jgi:hypothetical protein
MAPEVRALVGRPWEITYIAIALEAHETHHLEHGVEFFFYFEEVVVCEERGSAVGPDSVGSDVFEQQVCCLHFIGVLCWLVSDC